MLNQPSKSISRFRSDQYATVEFEGGHNTCYFGGEPGKLTVFIMIQGVCQIVGLSTDEGAVDDKNLSSFMDGKFRRLNPKRLSTCHLFSLTNFEAPHMI